MIKVRLTYTQTEKGKKELEEMLKILDIHFNILQKSKEYKGRGESKFSNVYVDLELED